MEIGAPLIWQIINFILLLLLLNYFLYHPLQQLLEKRSREVKERILKAREERSRAGELKEKARQELKEARIEARQLREGAAERGKEIKKRLLDRGREELEAESLRSQQRLKLAREQARQSLRQETGHLAVQVASRLLEDGLDGELHQRLQEQAVERLSRMKLVDGSDK